jgi:hypothetical protein
MEASTTVRFSWTKVALVLKSFFALEMVKMIFYRRFFLYFIYPYSGALALSHTGAHRCKKSTVIFKKPCDDAPYGTHRCAQRTKVHRYDLKKMQRLCICLLCTSAPVSCTPVLVSFFYMMHTIVYLFIFK